MRQQGKGMQKGNGERRKKNRKCACVENREFGFTIRALKIMNEIYIRFYYY